MLRENHAVVRIAPTGAEALSILRDAAYDVAFLDIHLPDANGLDLLPRLRELSPGTKVVVLSSDATPSNRECAFARGAWQFIEKPFDLDQIATLLGQCSTRPDERRASRRRLCRLEIHVEDVSTGADPPPVSFEAMICDVSDGGLRIDTTITLRPGQMVRLRTVEGGDPCGATLRSKPLARVVWVRAGQRGTSAGLAFVSGGAC